MRLAELAALMQRTEGVEITSYLVADPRLAKQSGVRVSHAGGLISWTMASNDEGFLNRALGFGTMSDATPGVLDRLERRFAAAGRPPRIAVAQGPTPRAALRLLERRGYVPEEGTDEHIYCYDRSTLPRPRPVDGLTIERVSSGDATAYAKLAFASFRERGPWFRDIVETMVRRRARGRHSAHTSDASRASRRPRECSSMCAPSAGSGTQAWSRGSVAAGSRAR
jgi:hypothetical protein